MEAVLACHEGGVLHCDVKPDNFLLRAPAGADDDDDDDDDAADNRDAALAAARRGHGLVLADFGRAIDRRRHDAGVRFATARDHAHLVAYEWPPARADRRCGPSARASWTVELDTYAVGVCLHQIALGDKPARDGCRRGALARAWDRGLWAALLDAHLCADADAGAPSVAERHAMVATTRAALSTCRFDDLEAELRRWRRRAAAGS
jgi:hypothetical protein